MAEPGIASNPHTYPPLPIPEVLLCQHQPAPSFPHLLLPSTPLPTSSNTQQITRQQAKGQSGDRLCCVSDYHDMWILFARTACSLGGVFMARLEWVYKSLAISRNPVCNRSCLHWALLSPQQRGSATVIDSSSLQRASYILLMFIWRQLPWCLVNGSRSTRERCILSRRQLACKQTSNLGY